MPHGDLPDLPIGAPLPHWQPPSAPSLRILHGSWCRLEPLDAQQHASALFDAWSQDPTGRMWTYLAYGPFPSAAGYHQWVERMTGGTDPLFYAICDEHGPAGVASWLRIEPRYGCIEVGGLAYSPRLQRSRAATEAMYLMMQEAFTLGYRRYEWKCNALNDASRAAALRLGFSFEGIFRQAAVIKRRNRDTAWYSIIDGEWPALHAVFQRWLAPDNFDASGRQRVRLSELTAAAVCDRRGTHA